MVVGDPSPTHVGAHFASAATALGHHVVVCDTREAYRGPAWRRRAAWWAGGRRPAALRAFSRQVSESAERVRPDLVLTTGLAPVDAAALDRIGRFGIVRANFLTDDPWNPAHRAPWFGQSLVRYDHVFTPRQANMTELRGLGGPRVTYLAFGYSAERHFPEAPADDAERHRFEADVCFAGGGDRDRIEVIDALTRAGLRVGLYGGYWDRFPSTCALARGFLDAAELRKATGTALVSLCLVRRANRDGHSMRTFEIGAMGGCMLVERTREHEALFGPDGEAVTYFDDAKDAAREALRLASDAALRARLAAASHRLVTGGRHTYADRLQAILARVSQHANEDCSGDPRPVSRV
jgi:hypothetical protein